MSDADPIDAHDVDEDGDHDYEECRRCLEENHSVRNSCRCGECCERLIIEVDSRDAAREPLIKLLGRKIRDFDGTYPLDEEADRILNRKEGGGCVFFRRDDDGHGVCGIHATRPLICRLFCCDKDMARIRGVVDGLE